MSTVLTIGVGAELAERFAAASTAATHLGAEALDAGGGLLARLEEAGSPLVLVLGADVPLQRALDLAARVDVSGAGTSVVVVGPSDPDLWVAAMRSGVRDVLSPDAGPDDVAAVLRRCAELARARAQATVAEANSDHRVIVVASAKGGVGKTTVSTNLAVGLARSGAGSTVIVELGGQAQRTVQRHVGTQDEHLRRSGLREAGGQAPLGVEGLDTEMGGGRAGGGEAIGELGADADGQDGAHDWAPAGEVAATVEGEVVAGPAICCRDSQIVPCCIPAMTAALCGPSRARVTVTCELASVAAPPLDRVTSTPSMLCVAASPEAALPRTRTPTRSPAFSAPSTACCGCRVRLTSCVPAGAATVPAGSSEAGSTKRDSSTCSPGSRSAVVTRPATADRSDRLPGAARRAGTCSVLTDPATSAAAVPVGTVLPTTRTATSCSPAWARASADWA